MRNKFNMIKLPVFCQLEQKWPFRLVLGSNISIGTKKKNVSCDCLTFYRTCGFYAYFIGIGTQKRNNSCYCLAFYEIFSSHTFKLGGKNLNLHGHPNLVAFDLLNFYSQDVKHLYFNYGHLMHVIHFYRVIKLCMHRN